MASSVCWGLSATSVWCARPTDILDEQHHQQQQQQRLVMSLASTDNGLRGITTATSGSNINSGRGMTMLASLHPTLPSPAITASPTSILYEQLLPGKRAGSQSPSACMSPPDIDTRTISSHALCTQRSILDMDRGGPGAPGGRFPLRVRLAAYGRRLKLVKEGKTGSCHCWPCSGACYAPEWEWVREFVYSRCACIGDEV